MNATLEEMLALGFTLTQTSSGTLMWNAPWGKAMTAEDAAAIVAEVNATFPPPGEEPVE